MEDCPRQFADFLSEVEQTEFDTNTTATGTLTIQQSQRNLLRKKGIAAFKADLGVSRGGGAPLAELLQLLNGIVAEEGQLRIQHGRQVAGVQEEAVAAAPSGIFGVEVQKFRIEHIDTVGSAHGSSGVAGLRAFNHT